MDLVYLYGDTFPFWTSVCRDLVQTWSVVYQTLSRASWRWCKSTAGFRVADVECWDLSADPEDRRGLGARRWSKDVLGGTGTYWAYSKLLPDGAVTIINTPLPNWHRFWIWVTAYYVKELESFTRVLSAFFFIFACLQDSWWWFSSVPQTCALAPDTGWLWFGINKGSCSLLFLGI